MAKTLITILILPVIYAKIEINIVASNTVCKSEISTCGTISNVISDEEISTFKLNEETLMEAVEKTYGKRPNDIYIKSPTPWNDLYKSYKWTEVTRVLKPIKASIVSITPCKSVIASQIFLNNCSQTTDVKGQKFENMTNSVNIGWGFEDKLTVEEEINYKFEVKTLSLDSKIMSFPAKWGDSHDKSQTVTANSEITIRLKPDERLQVDLNAVKNIMRIEIVYEASLFGTIAVNYADPYKGHHFYSLPLDHLMDAANLPKYVISKEIIHFTYHTDAMLEIVNPKCSQF